MHKLHIPKNCPLTGLSAQSLFSFKLDDDGFVEVFNCKYKAWATCTYNQTPAQARGNGIGEPTCFLIHPATINMIPKKNVDAKPEVFIKYWNEAIKAYEETPDNT
ncbi:hypothetical protein HN682_03340 [Candidatus Peregrinibacteria bacterium]|nr:hypothetical protein [Candidatus Peregrinibacteria bacterium]